MEKPSGIRIDCEMLVLLRYKNPNSFLQDKMAAISQTIYLDAFSWVKPFLFW